jgi:hypothetical protein
MVVISRFPSLHQWPSCTYAYCQGTQDELEWKRFVSLNICAFFDLLMMQLSCAT